jgi:hypothetical protein
LGWRDYIQALHGLQRISRASILARDPTTQGEDRCLHAISQLELAQDNQEEQMRAMHLGQRLAVAVALSLTLLIVGVVGLGMDIRSGDVVPPDLNISLSGLYIVAHITDPSECRIAQPCPDPQRDSYAVWVFYKTAPDDGGLHGGRMLVVPLQR